MRLKCIKLAGFKSFVDPTTVNFPSNLCAVVGPNGCGKSNIIDAVRWVMGESSAKNLRGEAMTDVIFNGSNTRKPIGQASIELVFDNSDGKVAGEYARFSEISVKRKVTRDGQNLYFLNGSKCRRRDITDIFLGTGLGPRSYAIIEQGMISRLIEAKPEELRVYVEEAAGISKYKERRRDTENRMRRTQENLERLTDIREELERQLGRLERQAQSAEKYKEFKVVERDLKAKLQAIKYRAIQLESEQKHAVIRDLEMQVEAEVTAQVHHDSGIEIERTRHAELSDKFNDVQAKFYSVGSEIARIEQTIQHVQERERQLKNDLQQTERDCEEGETHLAEDLHKAEGWQAELLEIEPEMELLSEAEAVSAESLQTAEETMQAWQTQWDNFNQRAAQPRQQAEVQQSRIQYLEQVQKRLIERRSKLEEEKDALVIGDVEQEIELMEEQLAEMDLQLEALQQKHDQASEDVLGLRDSERERVVTVDAVKGELQLAKGRHASLEALQQAAQTAHDSKVKAWLTEKGLDSDDRLATSLDVEPGWETAVETVLGSCLQAVCTSTDVLGLSSLDALASGELALYQRRTSTGHSAHQTSWLLSKVSSPVDLEERLCGVHCVEDWDAAMTLLPTLESWESVVTRSGVWLGHGWLRIARGTDASSGFIERKRQLEELTSTIESLEQRLQDSQADLKDIQERLTAREQEKDSLRAEKDALLRQQSDLRSVLSARTAKVEQVLEGRRRASKEIDEVAEQMRLETENLAEARAQLEEAIEAMEGDTREREQLLAKRDAMRSQLDQARQKARHDKDRAHELAMRVQSVKAQLTALNQGLGRLQEQLQRMQARRDRLRDNLHENQTPVADHREELEDKLALRIEVEEQLTAARRALEDADAKLREYERNRQQVEQKLLSIRGKLEAERLQAQTLDVQAQGLQQQLQEDQFDLQEVLERLDAEVTEKSLSEELTAVGNRIARLGAINLAAIDEYKTESERKHYLDAQNEDLCEALETLENAIRKIDRETRTRFKETFDQINSGLQELFPKVFGGGHAYLELTGEDLLDTGIAIMARPPGKRNSTIHLLSGGEKALTAIALVFSIFRLNPAPFCMLDEVDAPLDDANVGRYAKLVEEMSHHVQFIYITHNKIAMEMAHQLMGVTMHEPGVSRMVTVDVEQAAELAAV